MRVQLLAQPKHSPTCHSPTPPLACAAYEFAKKVRLPQHNNVHELPTHHLYCACAVSRLHVDVSAALYTLMSTLAHTFTNVVTLIGSNLSEKGVHGTNKHPNHLPDRDPPTRPQLTLAPATCAEVSQRRFVLVAADHPSTLIPLRPTIAYAPNRMLTIRCSCSQLSRRYAAPQTTGSSIGAGLASIREVEPTRACLRLPAMTLPLCLSLCFPRVPPIRWPDRHLLCLVRRSRRMREYRTRLSPFLPLRYACAHCLSVMLAVTNSKVSRGCHTRLLDHRLTLAPPPPPPARGSGRDLDGAPVTCSTLPPADS